jgi:hypothetical protein
MTLDEWIKDEIARIYRFRALWLDKQSKDPEIYPAELSAGEWDEQYRYFDDPGPSPLVLPLSGEDEMSEKPFMRIERRLVDYFDHIGLGFTVEQGDREWLAVRGEVEFSLTELAMALAADFPPPASLPEDDLAKGFGA